MIGAQTRTKAQQFESVIRHAVLAKGQETIAERVGVHRSQISRWLSGKDCMIEKFCLLLDAIEFDAQPQVVTFQGEGTAEIAKALLQVLEHIREPKEKAPVAATTRASTTDLKD